MGKKINRKREKKPILTSQVTTERIAFRLVSIGPSSVTSTLEESTSSGISHHCRLRHRGTPGSLTGRCGIKSVVPVSLQVHVAF